MKTKLSKLMENKKHTVIRVDSKEFELDNGDVYSHNFDIDENITVDEFQKLLDLSKDNLINHLKDIEGIDE